MKVSISCITYNHEKYIGETIQSFLTQKTDFEYCIEIHNDASTDNTKAEIEKYQIASPEKFKVIHHRKNKGVAKNFIDAMQQCTGEYIALCEGDDFWTDPLKLQKQVDFLDNNKSYSGCCHNVQLLYNDGEYSNHDTVHTNAKLDLLQLIEHMPDGMIATCSLVFRRSALGNTKWIEGMPFGDFPLWIHLYQSGPIFGLKESMGVYRKHSGGFTYGFNWDGYQTGYTKFYKAAREHVTNDLVPLLNKKIFEVYYHSGSQFVAGGEWSKAFLSFKNMFPFVAVTSMHIKALTTLSSKLFFYPVYKALKFFKHKFN